MLSWAWGFVGPNMQKNQYGSQRGCGTEQFLAHLWTGVLEGSEDFRGSSSVVSLDFSKAFNRLDHAHILQSYGRLGASTEVIHLLASFLSGQVMKVKVNGVLSTAWQVNGGGAAGIMRWRANVYHWDR